jgi:hypothetical protein
MKYDDASWHSGGNFPKDSPPEYGGTHIALLLKWCFLKGWAGELHVKESAADLEKLLRDEMPATEFLFKNCDGKFTDEDLSGEGNAFVAIYYGSDGPYLADYAEAFGDLMYVASEDEHDFKRFTQMVDRRYNAHTGGTKKPWWKPW